MDKFLETHSLPKLSQDKTDHLNRSITRSELECVRKNALQSPAWDGYTAEFYQTYKEVLTNFLRLFQKTEDKETLPKSLYETTITLIPKPGKDITKKENYRPIITDEYRCKNPQQNTSKQNPTTH